MVPYLLFIVIVDQLEIKIKINAQDFTSVKLDPYPKLGLR